MSGVGVVVYYKGEIYTYKWCKTIKKAFKKYHKEIANNMTTNLEGIDFDDVSVSLVYCYDDYCNLIKEEN